MSLDLQNLATCLAHTFNEQQQLRAQAETTLAVYEATPGCLALMLEIIGMPDAQMPLPVKQSASLRVKNIFQAYSTIRAGELQKISDYDFQMVRSRLLETIVKASHPLLRVQLLEVTYHAWPIDTPSLWPNLVPELLQNLQQAMSTSPPDLMRIYGCACMLRMVYKRYFNRAGNDLRAPLNVITEQTFPILLQIVQTLTNLGPQATTETREICRIIIKIFYQAITLCLPPLLLADFSRCVPWFDILCYTLEAPIPGRETVQVQGEDEIQTLERLRTTPGWKCKKWCALTLLRVYNRWGRETLVGLDKKQSKEERAQRKLWAKQFGEQYTTRVLGIIMGLLKQKSEGTYVTDRVVFHSLSYICTAITSSIHFKLLLPHLPFLIQSVLLQTFTLTQSEMTIWSTDPHEFIRRQLDFEAECSDPRQMAKKLLQEMIHYRTRDSLQLTLTTIQTCFETYKAAPDAQKNHLQKDAAMRMFCDIADIIGKGTKFRVGVEQILMTHILPEFTSALPYLRARACGVISEYAKHKWTNQEAHNFAVKSCVERLNDPELPVKLEAWNAVAFLIQNETTVDALKPYISIIVNVFYTLFDDIGNEMVVRVLSELVEKFGEDVTPYALQLIGKLTDLYLDMERQVIQATAENRFDDEMEELEGTAYHCLETIVACVYAVKDKPEVLVQLYHPICAIFDVSMNDHAIEMYEMVLDILSTLIYYPEESPIPECFWKYLPVVTGSWFTYASDFLRHMLPVFDTYLNKGATLLATPQGRPLIESMFNIAKKVISDPNNLIDGAQACVLIDSIVANLRGQIDTLIPQIVQMSAERLIAIITMEEEREKERKAKAAAKRKQELLQHHKIKKGKGGKKFLSKNVQEEDEDEEELEMAEYKLGLLDNIALCCHYNPLLFCGYLSTQPPQFIGKLFNVWLSYLPSMKNDFDVSKNAVLGLTSLVLIPIQSLPQMWRDALPQVLGMLLSLLTEMGTILDEAPEEEKEEEMDEEHNFLDVDPEKDVWHPDDEGLEGQDVDVDEAAEDGDENAPVDFINDMEDALLDDVHSTEKFVSPLDDIDPFIFFAQSIQTLGQQEPQFYQQWWQSIGAQGQAVFQAHMKRATEHVQEIAQEKAEEELEKQRKAAGIASPKK